MDTSYALDPLLAAARWRQEGLGVALATVVKTWGSAPRRVGAQMSINEDGEFAGSVSGGCVEGAVIQEAAGIIRDGGVKLLEFGVTNEEAWEVGLACGGEVRVFLERIDDTDLLRELNSAREAGEAVVVLTDLDSGHAHLVRPLDDGPDTEDGRLGEIVARDEAVLWEEDDRSIFVNVHNPPVRIVVVGAVHIAQSLAVMVREAGFELVVVDPRTAFATEERFPGVELVRKWPDEAFAELSPDHRTAVVTVTHDPKLDDPALRAALDGPAFYVGALGSRRTQAKRMERLRDAGVEDAALKRIHAPIGLDIGARSPGEIAASILAEIIQVLRRGPE